MMVVLMFLKILLLQAFTLSLTFLVGVYDSCKMKNSACSIRVNILHLS